LKIYDLRETDAIKLDIFFSKLPSSSWNSKATVSLLRNDSYEIKVIHENEDIIALILSNFIFSECNLLYIGVDPDFQKKGIGGLLIKRLIYDCRVRKIEKIYLEVRKSNQAAIFLYEKYGFNLLGSRKNYYPNGDHREDALLYNFFLGME
jgi:ribosomal-protein-alanine N-acetyltransferase